MMNRLCTVLALLIALRAGPVAALSLVTCTGSRQGCTQSSSRKPCIAGNGFLGSCQTVSSEIGPICRCVWAPPTRPSRTATVTPTATPTVPGTPPTATSTRTPTPTHTPTATRSPTATPSPTHTATGTPTSTAIGTGTVTRTVGISPASTPTPTPVPCVGDCGGTSSVAVNDLITLANIALGSAQASTCAHGIPSGAAVDVALIIQAVNSALSGCGL